MKRIAIILDEKLSAGEIGNVSAILMGQAGILDDDIFSRESIIDHDGIQHAAIKYSTVILKAKNKNQLINFCKETVTNDNIKMAAFTNYGQRLNNSFHEYNTGIKDSNIESLVPVGVIVIGDNDNIKSITKKFSLFK